MEQGANGSLMRRFRRRSAEVLYSADRDDRLTHWVDVGLIVLISLNILAVVLESMASLRESWWDFFQIFEIVSVFIFTVEFLLRVWSAVDNPWLTSKPHPVKSRLRYLRSWMAIIDLLAIAPFYLSFFFSPWTSVIFRLTKKNLFVHI